MYWKSKKKIYGIDNEIHLVEQVQKCIKILIHKTKNQIITHQDINDIFEKQSSKKQKSIALKMHLPQLNINELLSLKIAFNMKEIALKENVKKLFQTRFKRKLFKQYIITKVQQQVLKYIADTQQKIRSDKNRVFKIFYLIVKSWIFKNISFIVIIANTIVLSLTKNKQNEDQINILENLNLFFFGFFVFELLSKLIGEGFKFYLEDKFNWFDCSVVIVSAIDIIIAQIFNTSIDGNNLFHYFYIFIGKSNSSAGAITALRVLRLVRIFQLGRLWKDFQQMLSIVMHTIKDVANFSALFFLLLFCYLLVGMEQFAFKIQKIDEKEIFLHHHQLNFNNFLEAFLSVFVVLANDGWTRVYMNHYRQTDSPIQTTFFFVSLLICGQFILINLFISILINNFEERSVKSDLIKKISYLKKESVFSRIKAWISQNIVCNRVSEDHNKYNLDQGEEKIDKMIDMEYQEQLKIIDQELFEEPSLHVFKYKDFIRQVCLKIINHKKFENIMILITILSSIQLALDNPLNDPDKILSKLLLIVDYILTCIFGIEAILKIIANGLIQSGSRSYMRDATNIIDLLLLLITIISYAFKGNLNSVKALKLFKLLRPLRAINVNQNLKIAVSTLSVAFAEIFQIIIIYGLFLFVFGIISVNYFKGLFYQCAYNNVQNDEISSFITLSNFMKISNKWECLNLGLEWKNQFLNFDDIFQAMSTVFIVSCSVDWTKIMFWASKSQGEDLQANLLGEFSVIPILFFISIIVFGKFFISNLFIGVMIAKYNREQELFGKNFMLTDDQKKWVKNRLEIIYAKPIYKMNLPENENRQPFFYVAENVYFQNFVMFCIIINTFILSFQWYGQSEIIVQYMDNINVGLTLFFMIEFLIKFTGYGWRYFHDGWNIFDSFIALISLIGISISQSSNSAIGPQTTVIRSFRILRMFFFFRTNGALKSTMMTFALSFPAMINISALLTLINLVFSILGVYIFADIMPNGELNDYNNFKTITSSFITLIRIITGEKWPLLVEALSKKPSPDYQCVYNPSYEDYFVNHKQPVGCGSELAARIFFFSYSIIMGAVSIKLFIAIVWQVFCQTTERDNKFMNTSLVDHFREVWSLFDTNATSFVKDNVYPRFLKTLGEPLGWNISFEHNFPKQIEYLSEISLPKYNSGKEYQFLDVLELLLLIMIVRREVINFGIKTKHYELLGEYDERNIANYDDLIFQIKNQVATENENKRNNQKEQICYNSPINIEEQAISPQMIDIQSPSLNQNDKVKILIPDSPPQSDNRYTSSPPQNYCDQQNQRRTEIFVSKFEDSPSQKEKQTLRVEFHKKNKPLIKKKYNSSTAQRANQELIEMINKSQINQPIQESALSKSNIFSKLSTKIQQAVDEFVSENTQFLTKNKNAENSTNVLQSFKNKSTQIISEGIKKAFYQLQVQNSQDSEKIDELINDELTMIQPSQQNQVSPDRDQWRNFNEQNRQLIQDQYISIRNQNQEDQEFLSLLKQRKNDNLLQSPNFENGRQQKYMIKSRKNSVQNVQQLSQRIKDQIQQYDNEEKIQKRQLYEEAQQTIKNLIQVKGRTGSSSGYSLNASDNRKRHHLD